MLQIALLASGVGASVSSIAFLPLFWMLWAWPGGSNGRRSRCLLRCVLSHATVVDVVSTSRSITWIMTRLVLNVLFGLPFLIPPFLLHSDRDSSSPQVNLHRLCGVSADNASCYPLRFMYGVIAAAAVHLVRPL